MPYNPKIHHRRSVRLRGYDYAKEGMYFVTICVQNRACLLGEIRDKVMILSPYGEIAHREWEKLPSRWPHIELGEFQIMPNHIHGILVIHHPPGTTTTPGATTRVAPTSDTLENEEQVPLLITDNPDSPTSPTGDAMKDVVGATLVVAPLVVAPLVVAPLVVTPLLAADTVADTSPPDTPFTKMQWATRPTVGQIVGAYKSATTTQCLKWQNQNRPGIWLEKIWQRGFHEHIILTEGAFDNISHYIINNPENWGDDKFFEKQ